MRDPRAMTALHAFLEHGEFLLSSLTVTIFCLRVLTIGAKRSITDCAPCPRVGHALQGDKHG